MSSRRPWKYLFFILMPPKPNCNFVRCDKRFCQISWVKRIVPITETTSYAWLPGGSVPFIPPPESENFPTTWLLSLSEFRVSEFSETPVFMRFLCLSKDMSFSLADFLGFLHTFSELPASVLRELWLPAHEVCNSVSATYQACIKYPWATVFPAQCKSHKSSYTAFRHQCFVRRVFLGG